MNLVLALPAGLGLLSCGSFPPLTITLTDLTHSLLPCNLVWRRNLMRVNVILLGYSSSAAGYRSVIINVTRDN